MRRIFLFLIGLTAPLAEASFYPPDYVIEQQCQAQGPVKVCALNRQYGRYPRVRIEYHGALVSEGLSAFVQLNGKWQNFVLDHYADVNSLTLGDPTNVHICIAGTPGPADESLPPSSRPCQHTLEPVGSTVWELDPVPAAELELFTFAYDGYRPNAWDIEVAFFNHEGLWDSLYGHNYRFRFE